jgi:hypothetical protein
VNLASTVVAAQANATTRADNTAVDGEAMALFFFFVPARDVPLQWPRAIAVYL